MSEIIYEQLKNKGDSSMLEDIISNNIRKIASVLDPKNNKQREPKTDYKSLRIPRTREYWLAVEELREKLTL